MHKGFNRTPSSQSLIQVAAKTHPWYSRNSDVNPKLRIGIAVIIVLEALTIAGILLAAMQL